MFELASQDSIRLPSNGILHYLLAEWDSTSFFVLFWYDVSFWHKVVFFFVTRRWKLGLCSVPGCYSNSQLWCQCALLNFGLAKYKSFNLCLVNINPQDKNGICFWQLDDVTISGFCPVTRDLLCVTTYGFTSKTQWFESFWQRSVQHQQRLLERQNLSLTQRWMTFFWH